MSIIQLSNVQKEYPSGQFGLRQVDISIQEGEFAFIAGASGAGKSTLLKLLYGKEQVSGGEIRVAGRYLGDFSPRMIPDLRKEIGVVFQDYKLLPRLNVIDNVALGLEVHQIPRKVRLTLSRQMLEAVGLADKALAMPLTLSGGEQQRVAIARALIHRPRILIADEPSGSLDRYMTSVIFDLLREAHALGVTVIVATHNLAMIEEMNRRTIVLDGGRVIGDFPANEMH